MPQSFLLLIVALLSITFANAYYDIPLNITDHNGCGLGQEFRSGSCKLCRPGSYRFIGPSDLPTRDRFQCEEPLDFYNSKIEPTTTRCKLCPAGTYNPFPGVQTSERCRPCPQGTTSHAGATKCWSCGAKKSSHEGSPLCVRCNKGYQMTEPCAWGVKPSQPCSKCPIGSYSTDINTVQCTSCPGGMSTRRVGATSKKMCKPCGSRGIKCSCRQTGEAWGAVSSYRPFGASMCTHCPPGTLARSPFATKASDCKPCPNGTKSDSIYQGGCTPCPKGQKSFGAGANECRRKWTSTCRNGSFKNRRGVCKTCPAGYVWNKKHRECKLCPAGTVSEGYGQRRCKRCVFPNIAAPNRASCLCGPGHFKDYTGSYDCKPCPKGTKMEKELHDDSECDLDCEKFPDQKGCKVCPVNYGIFEYRGGCEKCKAGLITLMGEPWCVNPQTGCESNGKAFVQTSKYGYSIGCNGESS